VAPYGQFLPCSLQLGAPAGEFTGWAAGHVEPAASATLSALLASDGPSVGPSTEPSIARTSFDPSGADPPSLRRSGPESFPGPPTDVGEVPHEAPASIEAVSAPRSENRRISTSARVGAPCNPWASSHAIDTP
jgi:hypothetical protein